MDLAHLPSNEDLQDDDIGMANRRLELHREVQVKRCRFMERFAISTRSISARQRYHKSWVQYLSQYWGPRRLEALGLLCWWLYREVLQPAEMWQTTPARRELPCMVKGEIGLEISSEPKIWTVFAPYEVLRGSTKLVEALVLGYAKTVLPRWYMQAFWNLTRKIAWY